MMSAFLTTQDKIPGVVFNVYVFFCMLRKLLCADGIVLTKLWTGCYSPCPFLNVYAAVSDLIMHKLHSALNVLWNSKKLRREIVRVVRRSFLGAIAQIHILRHILCGVW